MKTLPYDKKLAEAVLFSVGNNAFTPRAACGANGIAYGDLLAWLEADYDNLSYRLEVALAQRIHMVEQIYLKSRDSLVQKSYFALLEVANPEGFSREKGEKSPVRQQKPTTKPFPREWVDTERSEGANAALPKRVVKLKTGGDNA